MDCDETGSGRKRNYAQSCMNCRKRKIKCEGSQNPPCRNCALAHAVCEPGASRPRKRSRDESRAAENDVPPSELLARLERVERALRLSTTPIGGGPLRGCHDQEEPRDETSVATLESPRFALGSTSQPTYHGETSMHDDPALNPFTSASGSLSHPVEHWSKERLRAACRLKHKFATPEEGELWMDAYFSWASPCYSVIHKPFFLRDMALGGPFFSDFLLVMIYTTGIRFTVGMDEDARREKGERFFQIAMGFVAQEMLKPSSIPTIQGLLGLAGRQCAVGNSSQGWLLTGMAIRMIQDMGLHLPANATVTRFSAEESEMRTRLYWSAYLWDKTISLTLGREPALLVRPGLDPDNIPDPSIDTDFWGPVFPIGHLPDSARNYPLTRTMTTFTLRYTCRLNMILEIILTNMYSPERPHARSLSFIHMANDRLEKWRSDLPSSIKLEGPLLPNVPPPPHVVLLNLLYHTMRILLFRPLLTARSQSSAVVSNALDSCRSAAIGVHGIMSLWGRTFGIINLVYLAMYCCFVAAGVDVILLRVSETSIRQETLKRVYLFLDILEQASSQGPGIRRGIEIVRAQLEMATREQSHNSACQPIVALREASINPAQLQPGGGTNAFYGPQPTIAAVDTALNMVADSAYSQVDFEGLMAMLGSGPIGTEDPFAFNPSADQIDAWQGFTGGG